jgi:uncharacterized damage-inducible protein DinB
METKEIILKSLEESQRYLNEALEGLTREELARSPGAESNSIIFIYWHLIRVEDIWINRVIRGHGELYDADGWAEKLGTPPKESGARYDKEKLKAWPVPEMEVLREYAAAVREKTMDLIQSTTTEKMAEVIRPDTRFDTVGAILTHLITEIALHVGQTHYLHGLYRGLKPPAQ